MERYNCIKANKLIGGITKRYKKRMYEENIKAFKDMIEGN